MVIIDICHNAVLAGVCREIEAIRQTLSQSSIRSVTSFISTESDKDQSNYSKLRNDL